MKKGILICMILISCFLLAGCNSRVKKEQFGKMYYSVGDSKTNLVKKNGTLDPGNKWESIQFRLDNVNVSIMRVEDRTIQGVRNYNAALKKTTIQNIEYYFEDKQVMGNLRQREYNTPVKKDMYTITILYQDTEKNKNRIKEFMESIEIEK